MSGMNVDDLVMRGIVDIELVDGNGEVKEQFTLHNSIKHPGLRYYARAGAALHSNGTVTADPAVTGMQLGADPSVTDDSFGIIYTPYIVTGSGVTIESDYPQITYFVVGSTYGWRTSWQCRWAAGVATNAAIRQASLTNVAGPPASTELYGDGTTTGVLSTLYFPDALDKQATDLLTITWHHEFNAS